MRLLPSFFFTCALVLVLAGCAAPAAPSVAPLAVPLAGVEGGAIQQTLSYSGEVREHDHASRSGAS